VTITLEGEDPNPGGDSSQLLFQIQTLPQYGTLSIPPNFEIKFLPITLPFSNPSTGWPVVYQLNSNYFNPQTNSDSFSFTLENESGLQYPFPLVVQLPLPVHDYPVVTPPPTNVVTNASDITVTLEAVDPNTNDNTTNLVFTITNLPLYGNLYLPTKAVITKVPFVLPYSASPTNGWPVVFQLTNFNFNVGGLGVTNIVDSFKFTVVDQRGDPYPFPLSVTFNIPQAGGLLPRRTRELPVIVK
jgi:hypothetical protein